MVAVKLVSEEKSLAGWNVAVMPAYLTEPEMGFAPCFTVKVAALIVAESIPSLNVALTVLLTPTCVELARGSVEVTVGTLGLANSTNCCPHPASDATTRTRRLLLRALIGRPLPSR